MVLYLLELENIKLHLYVSSTHPPSLGDSFSHANMLGLWFCLGELKKLFNASIWSTMKGLSSPLFCFLGCSSKNNAEEILDGKKMNLFSHFQPFF